MYETCLSFWDTLSDAQKESIHREAELIEVPVGARNPFGKEKNYQMLAVIKGRIRVYMLAEDGKEVTFYRMVPDSLCSFMLKDCLSEDGQIGIMLQAESNSEILCIPVQLHVALLTESAAYLKEQMESERDCCRKITGVVNDILSKRLDSRIAKLLLEESSFCGTNQLKITHEEIACHLGSAREVVTRILKDLQKRQMLILHRGAVVITDREKLKKLI